MTTMDEDLEFIINALSVPNTPLTAPYNENQLHEMRESFKTLQKLLRRNVFTTDTNLPSMPRSKAGGGKERIEERGLSSMLALVGSDLEKATDPSSGSINWNSPDSGARTSPIISELGLRDQDHDQENPLCSSSSGISDGPDFGDMAIVPYEELLNERSSSDTTITGQSFSSGISISIPVNLVWNNQEYYQESTDSETTLKPDGLKYSVLN
ncbi:uncharacterized protein LOC108089135 [Drosophila ficusphila]|uniref:uncharacterized protein LOC108089135 n=1 Tax=Drosophila ficusphila TaxID=30025 RepID=UPI0007E76832|nr:uncharacterized protein LOC108089135 [Drosophila ficusphila]